jgi:hypothetical protein
VADGVHPTKIDKRKPKHVDLHHLAWNEVLSRAVVEKEHRGVADPDQAYMLGELIRYLEHPRSGALEFEDMGPSWVPVRNAVADGTLRSNNPEAADVAGRFEALLRFAALQLGTRLGTDVTVAHSRKALSDPASRISSQVTNLVDHGRLQGALRIPNTVGPLEITADLRARSVICSAEIDAPKEGRPTTKVNWLVRQLKQTNDRARLECNVMNQRGNGASDLLGRVRESPDLLILDPTRTIRSFTVALNSPMGFKSGRGQGTFIDGLLGAIDTFYAEVLQSLKAWAAKPPRMREQTDTSELAKDQEVPPALVSTALSSQDGPTLEEANSLSPGSA